MPFSGMHVLVTTLPFRQEQGQVSCILRVSSFILNYSKHVCCAGKTSTLLAIAGAMNNKNVQILTYNRALANECNEKISVQKINAQCSTVHSKFGQCCKKICNDDFELLCHGDVFRFDADVIMIDEVQDLRPVLLEAILKMIPIEKQIIVVGDELQILYDYCIGDKATDYVLLNAADAFVSVTTGEWKHHTLLGSYRLTQSCAAFVNCIWNSNIISLSPRPDAPVDIVLCNPWSSGVAHFIEKMIQSYGAEHVLLLSQSVLGPPNPLRMHVNKLLKKGFLFHIKEFQRGFDNSECSTNRTRVWTYCSSKGCEAKVVIVFGLDRCPAANDLGVACSRATERMFILHDDSKAINCIFKDLTYSVRYMQLSRYGDMSIHYGKRIFGEVESHCTPNTRFTVSDRSNISARVLYDLFHHFEFQTKVVHSPFELETNALFHGIQEDVSALYGKQMEYLLQVNCNQSCPDACMLQLSGAKISSKDNLAEFFSQNNVTHSSLDTLTFPMSTSLIRRKCNTHEVELHSNGRHVHLVSDSCKEIHHIHHQLTIGKHVVDAMKLANCVLAMDSYEDRKMMITDYSWVQCETVEDMVKAVFSTMPDLHSGTFEHQLTYTNNGICLCGKVDWMCQNQVIDFKMTSEVSSDHKFQILLYTALHALLTQETATGSLYYIRKGVLVTVQMDFHTASHLIERYMHVLEHGTIPS